MLTAILRTLVPALWGSFIAWLLGLIPALAPLEAQLLGVSEMFIPVLTAVLIGAWYAFWRWLEPRLPNWITTAVLGSAKTPSYQGKNDVVVPRFKLEGWHDTRPLTGADWREFAESLPASEQATALLAVADALDEGAPADYKGKHAATKATEAQEGIND